MISMNDNIRIKASVQAIIVANIIIVINVVNNDDHRFSILAIEATNSPSILPPGCLSSSPHPPHLRPSLSAAHPVPLHTAGLFSLHQATTSSLSGGPASFPQPRRHARGVVGKTTNSNQQHRASAATNATVLPRYIVLDHRSLTSRTDPTHPFSHPTAPRAEENWLVSGP